MFKSFGTVSKFIMHSSTNVIVNLQTVNIKFCFNDMGLCIKVHKNSWANFDVIGFHNKQTTAKFNPNGFVFVAFKGLKIISFISTTKRYIFFDLSLNTLNFVPPPVPLPYINPFTSASSSQNIFFEQTINFGLLEPIELSIVIKKFIIFWQF